MWCSMRTSVSWNSRRTQRRNSLSVAVSAVFLGSGFVKKKQIGLEGEGPSYLKTPWEP